MLLTILLGCTLSGYSQRIEKMLGEKYAKHSSLDTFVYGTEYLKNKTKIDCDFLSDEYLNMQFESRGIKYVLIDNYRLYGAHSKVYPHGYLYCKESEFRVNEPILMPKEGYFLIKMSDSEFKTFSYLISESVKNETMFDYRCIVKSYQMFDNCIIVTYFDGKKKNTAYFLYPELSLGNDISADNEKKYEFELRAARYLMYAWRYAITNSVMVEQALISSNYSGISNLNDMLERLDRELKEIVKEDDSEILTKNDDVKEKSNVEYP